MIDFTNCPVNRFRAYGGANGNKINITYQGHSYMLKFPPKPSRNRDMSYSNGCISEYIACHIFEMLGFRTQETLLGNYTDSRSKTKLVVACRDFTEDGKRLIEFAHLKNTCILHRKADIDRGAASGVSLLHGHRSRFFSAFPCHAQPTFLCS